MRGPGSGNRAKTTLKGMCLSMVNGARRPHLFFEDGFGPGALAELGLYRGFDPGDLRLEIGDVGLQLGDPQRGQIPRRWAGLRGRMGPVIVVHCDLFSLSAQAYSMRPDSQHVKSAPPHQG